MARSHPPLRTLIATAAACAAALLAAPAAQAKPAAVAYALNGASLVSFDPAHPESATPVAIAGVAPGETLVDIDVRPANGMLYGLGVNATANSGTLYVIAPTGFASPVGPTGGIALTTDGATAVDLPDPAVAGYGLDVNPTADRIRVTTSTTLNFRINPNTGLPLDGNNGGGTTAGTNPDGPINGATTSVDGVAYASSGSNVATATTLYALDSATDQLTIQNPANTGTQVSPQALTLGGTPLNASATRGFDLDPAVAVTTSNTAATGDGYAILTVGAATHLYKVALATGAATDLGPIGDGSGTFHGLALQRDLNDGGRPAVGLLAGGTSLRRFMTQAPAAADPVAQPVTGLQAGEILVGLAWRPATGQLLGLGADTTADTGTLYVIDPSGSSSASATVIGTPGQVAWVGADGVTPVDLPPATAGWGIDVNPAVDRVRVVAAGGLNARIDPVTGGPVDGQAGAIGTNPDTPHNGAATSVTATAYSNAFPQAPGGVSTQYALDPASNQLLIQTPPNLGTLTGARSLTLPCGGTVDFDPVGALDLPGDAVATTSGAEAPGTAFAALTVGGAPGLYKISLPTGYVNGLGTLPAPLSGLAVGEAAGAEFYAIPACVPPPGPSAPPIRTPERKPPVEGFGDETAPGVTRLSVKARSKKRLTIAFTTTEAGRATVELQRKVAGRRTAKRRCVAGRRKGARCSLYKTYKKVVKDITKPGRVTVSTTGRTGAVRVLVTVRDRAGNASKARTKTATVKR